MAELVAVKPLSGERVSVAVSVQLVPVVMVTAVKVATAELAVARVVPVRVHEEESWMVSDAPGLVAGLPLPSSTVTAKLASALPAVAVAPGSTVKTRWVPANACLLYTSPSPRDRQKSRMP